jgi:DNA polymerase III subunit gamma/tau
MSDYIVTARKWRPMKFEDVAGQAHITTTLRNAISSRRLAHAYLFSGPRGVGKTTTARLLAKAVNCAHPADQNPDNTCESCLEITEGRSFDVLEIDGASNRGVEEIRNLRESVRYAPTKGSYKVYIIDEVHMLTKEAFNALLKTLEEPPPHVLFVFATTELHKVPATILSRCQRFEFRRIRTEEITANLRAIAKAEDLHADDDALMLVARKADGSLRDAQSLFDQVIALCGRSVTSAGMVEALNMVDQEVYFRVTDLVKSGDVAGGLALVDELMRQGHDLREFLGGLIEHFRNLLVVKSTGSTELIEASDLFRGRYAKETGAFSVADLLRLQRLVAGTESALRWTTQPRFKVEADIVQLISQPKAQEVAELLRRLDEVKKNPGSDALTPAPVARPVSSVRSAAPSRSPEPAPHSPVPTGVQASTVRSAPPPPAGPSGAIAEGEISSRWPEFLDAVRKTKISLWSSIESMEILGVEGSSVRLSCADEFQAAVIQKNREVLSDIFQTIFHVRPRLVAEIGAGEPPPRTPRGTEQRKEAAKEHPVVAALKRELGAEPL